MPILCVNVIEEFAIPSTVDSHVSTKLLADASKDVERAKQKITATKVLSPRRDEKGLSARRSPEPYVNFFSLLTAGGH